MKAHQISPDQPHFEGLPGVVPFQPAGRADDGYSPRAEVAGNPRAAFIVGQLPSATTEPPHYPMVTAPRIPAASGPEVQITENEADPNWADAFKQGRTPQQAAEHRRGLAGGQRIAGEIAIRAAAVGLDDRLTNILKIAAADRRARSSGGRANRIV